jgi:hypothetical protein
MRYYLTFDFVDRKDAARRMPFHPEPTGVYADPDGLIADWRRYAAKVHELFSARKMSTRRVDCPAMHCWGDATHPEVKELAATFAPRVAKHVTELSKILVDDREGGDRAAAAFLLAYAPDRPAVLRMLVSAFRDPDALVRNNAMRVAADVAHHHPELEVPIEPVLDMLDYPDTTDRNKSSAVLHYILKQPGKEHLRPLVRKRAGAILIAMLRLQQPNNHDFAYGILKILSGQDFGERAYAAWETWLASQNKR